MNTLIIDDEELARRGLKEYLEEINFLHLSGEAENPVQAMEIMQTTNIDLLLCDIQMPLLDGIAFVRQLKNAPLIIFTTAYPNYALQGYELDVVDYLVKPFGFDRFFKAVSKAKELFHLKNKETDITASIIKCEEPDFCFIKTDKGFIKLMHKKIIFIEALHNYVVFNTVDGKYISYLTLSNAEASLPATQFLKIHKSYIVNLHHIKKIQTETLWVGETEIPFSRNNKDEIMNYVTTTLIQRKKE